MKVILQDNNNYILRFDKGETVFQGLADFMSSQQISACNFSGIGSCSNVELGFYNPFLKEYKKKPYIDEMEIISLTGNGSILDSDKKPTIHAHGIFGRIDFTVLGGHVFEIVVLATCEIFLTKLNGTMTRKNNPELNLNLLD